MNRRWIWVLAGAGLLVLLLAAPVYWHVHARMALAKYRKELLAKGEKLTVRELVPLPPTNGFNGLPRFLAAAPQLGLSWEVMPSMMRHVKPGRARVGWKQGTNDWGKLAAAVAGREDGYAEVRAALEAPWFHDELNYEDAANMMLPNLTTIKSAAQGLYARAMLEFHEGKGKEAKQHVLAGVRLARLGCNEPIMISHLVKIAIEAIAWSATWEALQYPEWQESELLELQQDWMALEGLEKTEKTIEMERAIDALSLQKLREGDAKAWSGFSGGGGSISGLLDDIAKAQQEEKKSFLELAVLRIFGKTFWRWWWSFEEELVDAQVFQATLETLRKVERESAYFEPARQLAEFNKRIYDTPRSKICFYLSQGSERFCAKVFATLTKREMIITALALKRYHLRHRKYPAELSQLVPEFLPKLPIDWVDGKPLRYKINDDQHFVLYSIGEDGKDDGGDVSEPPETRTWWRSKDWVFPEPATDQEVAEMDKAEAAKKRRGR